MGYVKKAEVIALFDTFEDGEAKYLVTTDEGVLILYQEFKEAIENI
jgi:hypothetical protein